MALSFEEKDPVGRVGGGEMGGEGVEERGKG